MKLLQFIFAIVLIALVYSCGSDSSTTQNNTTNNVDVTNRNDTLIIDANTTSYNYSQNYSLTFSHGSVKVSFELTDYGGGSGDFQLTNNIVTIYSKSFNGNVGHQENTYSGTPTSASFNLSGFTGKVKITITGI